MHLDDGWGVKGLITPLYGDGGLRVLYARGHYEQSYLPDIRGQAVAEYGHTLSDELAKAEQKANGLTQDLIKAEWGSSENNRQAKFYELTRTGKKQLAQETENWERLSAAVDRILQTT